MNGKKWTFLVFLSDLIFRWYLIMLYVLISQLPWSGMSQILTSYDDPKWIDRYTVFLFLHIKVPSTFQNSIIKLPHLHHSYDTLRWLLALLQSTVAPWWHHILFFYTLPCNIAVGVFISPSPSLQLAGLLLENRDFFKPQFKSSFYPWHVIY